MRFFAGFLVTLAVVLGASFLFVSGPEDDDVTTDDVDEAGEVALSATATPVPSPSATPPPPTPEPTPTPEGPTTVTMVFSGEVLSHGSVIRQAAADATDELPYNYVPMFSQVAPLLEAVDFAVCHVETPVSSDNVSLTGFPVFNAPKEMPAGLKAAGYDGCSTASNHSLDKGPAGVVSTLDQMEAAGLPQAGMARSAEEAEMPTLYQVGDVKVGHLSYTYGLNGFVLPADQPYLVNVTDADTILAEAAAAKAAGANFVVLSIQWGNEYQVEPSEFQVDLATTFLDSPDIDLIMGAHVHVVQPADKINDKWVVYGLGNFLSNQSAECCPAASQNGIMAFVEITGTEVDGFAVSDLSFLPTRVDRSDYTIVPLPLAVEDPELDPGVKSLYEDVIASTADVVNRRGAGLEIFDFSGAGE